MGQSLEAKTPLAGMPKTSCSAAFCWKGGGNSYHQAYWSDKLGKHLSAMRVIPLAVSGAWRPASRELFSQPRPLSERQTYAVCQLVLWADGELQEFLRRLREFRPFTALVYPQAQTSPLKSSIYGVQICKSFVLIFL